MNSLRGIAGRVLDYDAEDCLFSAGGTGYQYDLDGFLISKASGAETTYYDYSSRGELLSVDLPDGTAITYVHDPLGRRIAKKVNGTIVEKYLWSGLTTLLAVYDGADNLLMRFVYADGRMPVAVEKGGITYYLAYDQVGSLRAVADGSGNIIKQVDYDSFGFVLNDTNPGFEVPFGFAGGLYDRDTGLVRFGYRHYDPDIGRWTAKDPIGFAGGDSDLYGYCLNDPVNLVDPLGTENMYQGYTHFYPHYNTINHHPKINLTKGQETAITKTGIGIAAIAGGALTGQPEVIAAGIIVLADGTALSIAEFLGGDTSNIPSEYEIAYDILKGIVNNWPEDKACP